MSVNELVQKVGKGREWKLKRGDYIFERILSKTEEFLVYDTQSKKKPLYTIPEEKFEEEWIHSTVVRLTKLAADEGKIKSLFDQFDFRKKIDYEKCPHLLTFHDQGIIQWQKELFYACRYDDPCRDFNYWINVDHQGLEIEALDCFRIARGCLEAFNYLESNGLWLSQFNDRNLYVGSFSEDRGNFFRIMFKGDSNKKSSWKLERSQFAPPEAETSDLYKSYAFSVGLMILWAIYNTNGKGGDFPTDLHKDQSKLTETIKNAVEICYKEGKEKSEHKDMFKIFLEDLLEPNMDKRRKASELLTYKWIVESDKLDYEEYQREVEENERAKQKEKEEEEKNKFN